MIEASTGADRKRLATLRCWGDFRLVESCSSTDLRPRGRKARAVVAYLACHPGTPVGRERLLGLLWGERGEEQARGSLRQAIQELKPLANGRAIIAIDRDSLTLDPAKITTDLDRLRTAVEQEAWGKFLAHLPEPDERIFADLDDLDSGFDDWLAIERARQSEILIDLIGEASLAAQRAGDARSARTLEARLRERDPARAALGADTMAKSPVSPLIARVRLQPPSAAVRPQRLWLPASIFVLVMVVGVSAWGLTPGSPASPVAKNVVATSSEVSSLYAKAQLRVRERNPQSIEEGRALLERALAIDPNFAPAWARLALVARLEGNRPGPEGQRARVEALRHARHALALAPELAEAHGVMGVILGFDNQTGRRYIERAAAIDPESAEIQFWLGHVYAASSQFPRALDAFRRASELDPAWIFVAGQAAEMALSLGRRDEALTYIRRVEREGTAYDAKLLRGLMALSGGDLSGAALALGEARASTDDLGKQAVAVYNRAVILYAVGLTDEAQREWASCRLAWAEGRNSSLNMPERYAGHLALRRGELPSLARLAEINRMRDDPRAEVYIDEVIGRMVAAGRAQQLIDLYDGRDGLLGFSRSYPTTAPDAHVVRYAPIVAAALIAVRRDVEARRLLQLAERHIDAGLRRSNNEVGPDFWGRAARTWAMLGKKDMALAALERAIGGGWLNADLDAEDLPDDLGTEITFRNLRGEARFERLRATLNRQLLRERTELARSFS